MKEVEVSSIITYSWKYLKYPGVLYVSFELLEKKGSSKIKIDLKREPIWEYVLNTGLVEVKVAYKEEDWSGLKFVYRLTVR